ncbi:MAG: VanZ family protein [Clostridia bacterium]|nr:VanZ family protein [Clostridia bacterium]
MAGIFCFSHQTSNESGNISKAVAEKVYENVDLTPERFEYKNDTWLLAHYEYLMRKIAHLLLYIGLGVLFTVAISEYTRKGMNIFIISISLGIIYAISDEIHQYFVPGRSFLIKDIIIDSVGIITGAGVTLLLFLLIKRIKRARKQQ